MSEEINEFLKLQRKYQEELIPMRHEDSHERLMRLLRQHQSGLIERVSRGHATANNEAGGYMHTAGQVVGMDDAIRIVRQCLYGDPPTDVEEAPARAYGIDC